MKRRHTPKRPKPQQAFIVRLHPQQHRDLRDYAEVTGQSMNEVVQDALAVHLAEVPKPEPEDVVA